jgi:uncharacterized protein
VKELGLKRFKLSPIYQSFHPIDRAAWRIYASPMECAQTDKILFGTDWPITTARETIQGIRNVNQFAKIGLPRIPEEILEAIIYRDSLSLLAIG